MKPVTVSAPGKAVLSGEYAVLRNAAAISVALDRRATVRLARSENDFHVVATPGYAEGRWRFTANHDGEIDWLDKHPDHGLQLLEEAWRVCKPRIRDYLSITIDTVDFFAADAGRKLGLGGSAAAMSALVGAIVEVSPQSEDVVTLAARAHKALQSGLGSGVDIATSCFGGVIEFRMDSFDAPKQCPWPDGLAYRFLWSGRPADTRSKIRKLDSGSGNEKGWASLSRAAEATASAWKRNDITEILDVFDRYSNTLRQFSIDHDLGIFDAGHNNLYDLAASFDVRYKPCGAGGGDIGIVLASNENAIERFCVRAEILGFKELDVLLDPTGIKFSTGDEC